MLCLVRWIAVLGCCLGLVGCGASSDGTVAVARPTVELPAPRTSGDLSLEATLRERRSVREFTDEPLSIQEIGQLLWAAQGITASWGGRTAPSAGGLYPLEVYVATADGVWHYLPQDQRAEVVRDDDARGELTSAAHDQDPVGDAPAVIVITAVPARTAAKYGDRAERYVQLEAGHVAQNVLLQAVALDLGAVPIGAFDDDDVASVLLLDPDQVPLYLIPVGHPAA
jgi:SagB-type dehydrogenase family enzyme